MPGEGGRGQGGDRNTSTTQATKARKASGGDEGMTRGPGTTSAPIPQWGTAADGDSKGTLHRHPDGARPENGMQSRRKYGLLASEDPAGDPAAVGTQVRRDGHGTTRGIPDQGQTEMETGDRTGKRTLLACSMSEDNNGERRPLKR